MVFMNFGGKPDFGKVMKGAGVPEENIQYFGKSVNGHLYHVMGIDQKEGFERFFESLDRENASIAHPEDVIYLRCMSARKMEKDALKATGREKSSMLYHTPVWNWGGHVSIECENGYKDGPNLVLYDKGTLFQKDNNAALGKIWQENGVLAPEIRSRDGIKWNPGKKLIAKNNEKYEFDVDIDEIENFVYGKLKEEYKRLMNEVFGGGYVKQPSAEDYYGFLSKENRIQPLFLYGWQHSLNRTFHARGHPARYDTTQNGYPLARYKEADIFVTKKC